MTKSRISGRVDFTDNSEKDFFYKAAEKLGFKSFKDFAITAMKKEIEANNYEVSMLNKIADLATDLCTALDHEPELTPEQEQVHKAANLIYDIAVNTDIMLNAPENQVFVDDPVFLEGEEPYWGYKHALGAGFDLKKLLER